MPDLPECQQCIRHQARIADVVRQRDRERERVHEMFVLLRRIEGLLRRISRMIEAINKRINLP